MISIDEKDFLDLDKYIGSMKVPINEGISDFRKFLDVISVKYEFNGAEFLIKYFEWKTNR
jgi:hypothetical protein